MEKGMIISCILLGVWLLCGSNAMAQDEDVRKAEFGMELTSELQTTNKGDFNFVNLLRLDASLPIISNISIDAASLSTYMTAEESIGGDLQTFSNLDAGNILFAISVFNVAWQINDKHSLYAGIRNMNEDYFTSPAISFFTNSSCGIFPTISANYPIANYPVASVGVHYCYDFNPVKVQASLYNGTGYNHFTGRENVFRVCPADDGVFGLAQLEYSHNGSSYFLGNSVYYNKGASTTPWFYAEQNISNSMTLLAGYSHAFTTDAVCKDFIGLGLNYQREKYELGIFSDMARFEGTTEFATEISGRINLSQNIYLQPTAHAIFTGNTFHAIASLRFGISL